MVRNFDSYAYACGFESGLRHSAYGTFGQSRHPSTLSFSVLSRQCLKMRVLDAKVGDLVALGTGGDFLRQESFTSSSVGTAGIPYRRRTSL